MYKNHQTSQLHVFFLNLPGVSSISWTYRSTCTKTTVAGRGWSWEFSTLEGIELLTKGIPFKTILKKLGCLVLYLKFMVHCENSNDEENGC